MAVKKLDLDDPAPILDDEDEETLAAIDEGLRDAEAGRTVPIEEVRKRLLRCCFQGGLMIPSKARHFVRIRRRSAERILLCFFVLGLLAGNGQIDLSQRIADLKSDSYITRERAAVALGVLKDSSAVEPLIAALKDTELSVRNNAAEALEKIGAPAVEPLIVALKDPDDRVRLRAARVLGARREPRVVSALLTRWRNRDLAVIAGAYPLFIKRGEPGSEDALIQAFYDFSSADLYGQKMAEAFLNCGNSKLDAVASKWLTANHYFISTLPGGGGVRWGGGR
jgi:HEAT repeats